MDDYRDVNRANWDERVAAHAASPDYAVSRFTEDPAFLSEVVRFDLPRLGDIRGPRRRAPAVPHRHRHRLAGTARRAHDGARLLGSRDRAGPPARRGRGGSESTSSNPICTARPKRSAASASISSTPASARSAGCPTSGAGRKSSRACCGPAAGSSSARAIRCCGRSVSRAPTTSSPSSTPTSSNPSPTSSTTRHVRRDRPGVREQRHPLLEPRPRRDRHGAVWMPVSS